jgi:hypothetical protein
VGWGREKNRVHERHLPPAISKGLGRAARNRDGAGARLRSGRFKTVTARGCDRCRPKFMWIVPLTSRTGGNLAPGQREATRLPLKRGAAVCADNGIIWFAPWAKPLRARHTGS